MKKMNLGAAGPSQGARPPSGRGAAHQVASVGATKLALFDLDHTLIPLDSDFAWGRFTTDLGWTNANEFIQRNDAFYQQYKEGTLDIAEYVRFATAAICHQGAAKSEAARADYMRDVIQRALRPQALELVRAHQDAGDAVVIVTATNEFVTRPIATAFGVPELIAIDLQRDRATGWFTGEIAGTPSFREGKVARMEQWLADRGWQWAQLESTFYSDSINDLPLLEKVTHPVATNPDQRLRAIAVARGWRILDLFSEDAAA
jgi:HAD superfamily hydrolase (TIGR01490 family)